MSRPTLDVLFTRTTPGPFTDRDSVECFGTPVFGFETMSHLIRLSDHPSDRVLSAVTYSDGRVDARAWLIRIPVGLHFLVRVADISARDEKRPRTEGDLRAYIQHLQYTIWQFCELVE